MQQAGERGWEMERGQGRGGPLTPDHIIPSLTLQLLLHFWCHSLPTTFPFPLPSLAPFLLISILFSFVYFYFSYFNTFLCLLLLCSVISCFFQKSALRPLHTIFIIYFLIQRISLPLLVSAHISYISWPHPVRSPLHRQGEGHSPTWKPLPQAL